jgi:SOS-response transcriptional repressor LexA
MSPEYPDGELIFVDPMIEARPGRDVIARLIERDETTFKRYKVEDGRPYLFALNPNWPERYIPVTEKATIKGVVIFSGKRR